MLCDFFRKEIQEKQFWEAVHDWDEGITAEKLCGKKSNAIVKYERMSKKPKHNDETMNNDLTRNMWQKPQISKKEKVRKGRIEPETVK